VAEPLAPDALVNALRAEGCRVVTVDQWRTHNRNHKGPWGPIHGVMVHHTVSKGDQASVDLCYDGYEGLPGPLCQGVIGKDGTVYVISAGRANHAGGGDPNVLAAVKDERYNATPPKPQVGNAAGIDGNRYFYGWECVNLGDGKDPWPAAQVEAIVRASAAVCRVYRWTEKSVIGHKEWSRDKSDPRGPGDVVDMPKLRAKIAERLAHPASWSPTAPATPTTGTRMKPDRLLVRRPENLTLLHGIPQTVYWTQEFPDDANQHGDGGKTVGTNVVYNGIVNLRLTGLKLGEYVEVYAAEEDANGNLLGESEIRAQIDGRMEGFHPVAKSVPVHGSVANRLVIRVVAYASAPVTLEDAWLSLHTDPLS
jgi:hypothetical protein